MALTDVTDTDLSLDIFATQASPEPCGFDARVLAHDTQAFVGEAAIEIEILDTETDEVLVAAVDRRLGRQSISGADDSWSDVHEAFEFWAARIRARLAQARRGEQ